MKAPNRSGFPRERFASGRPREGARGWDSSFTYTRENKGSSDRVTFFWCTVVRCVSFCRGCLGGTVLALRRQGRGAAEREIGACAELDFFLFSGKGKGRLIILISPWKKGSESHCFGAVHWFFWFIYQLRRSQLPTRGHMDHRGRSPRSLRPSQTLRSPFKMHVMHGEVTGIAKQTKKC